MGYEYGFSTAVNNDGDVIVESQHYHETVVQVEWPFGRRPVKRMRRIVERAKKRLAKKEEQLYAIKKEFIG